MDGEVWSESPELERDVRLIVSQFADVPLATLRSAEAFPASRRSR